jgi:hypothetical protein
MTKRIKQISVPSQEKCYNFYKLTKESLKSIATQKGISDLELKNIIHIQINIAIFIMHFPIFPEYLLKCFFMHKMQL